QLALRRDVPGPGRFWQKVLTAYRGTLRRCLNHRFEVVILVFLLGGISLWAKQAFVGEALEENNSRFYFGIEFDEAIAFHARSDHLVRVEEYLAENKERFDIEQVRVDLSR